MVPGMIAIIPPAFVHESRADTGEGVCHRCIHSTGCRGERSAPLQVWDGAPFTASFVELPPPVIGAMLPLVVTAGEAQPVHFLLEELFAALRAKHRHADIFLWPMLRHLLTVKAGGGVIHRTGRKPLRAALAGVSVPPLLKLKMADNIKYNTSLVFPYQGVKLCSARAFGGYQFGVSSRRRREQSKAKKKAVKRCFPHQWAEIETAGIFGCQYADSPAGISRRSIKTVGRCGLGCSAY